MPDKPQVHKLFCPRCDRPFVSSKPMAEFYKRMSKHMKRAHPDSHNPFEEDED